MGLKPRRWDGADDRPPVRQLLRNIRAQLPELEMLLEHASSHWGYEDAIYRFYHHSFKVYYLQATTEAIVAALRELLPGHGLNAWFVQIVSDGTGRTFEKSHNREWLHHTRPIVEAFFHARYFLEMTVRYGRELEQPPTLLPSGWVAVLYLYDLR